MPPIRISLSPEQIALAQAEAERRQSVNEQAGLRGRNRAAARGSQALSLHKLGALGEVAVAYHLGLEQHLFQDQTPCRGSADLPHDIEVKTRSKHWHDLIVQKDERPDKKIVLVTIQSESDILIQGWCVAEEVMREEFWSDPARGRPAYFVPKRKLKSIESLKNGESLKSPNQSSEG